MLFRVCKKIAIIPKKIKPNKPNMKHKFLIILLCFGYTIKTKYENPAIIT
jgi:hypothetical protein